MFGEGIVLDDCGFAGVAGDQLDEFVDGVVEDRRVFNVSGGAETTAAVNRTGREHEALFDTQQRNAPLDGGTPYGVDPARPSLGIGDIVELIEGTVLEGGAMRLDHGSAQLVETTHRGVVMVAGDGADQVRRETGQAPGVGKASVHGRDDERERVTGPADCECAVDRTKMSRQSSVAPSAAVFAEPQSSVVSFHPPVGEHRESARADLTELARPSLIESRGPVRNGQ